MTNHADEDEFDKRKFDGDDLAVASDDLHEEVLDEVIDWEDIIGGGSRSHSDTEEFADGIPDLVDLVEPGSEPGTGPGAGPEPEIETESVIETENTGRDPRSGPGTGIEMEPESESESESASDSS